MLRAAGGVADITGQAVGCDHAEPDTRDDRNAGLLGALVQVVESAEYLQFVADVEVVHSRAQAGFGERRCGMQERAGGVAAITALLLWVPKTYATKRYS